MLHDLMSKIFRDRIKTTTISFGFCIGMSETKLISLQYTRRNMTIIFSWIIIHLVNP